MDWHDRCLGVALCCLSAASVLALVGLVGAETFAAFGLTALAAVLVTVCLANLSEGK